MRFFLQRLRYGTFSDVTLRRLHNKPNNVVVKNKRSALIHRCHIAFSPSAVASASPKTRSPLYAWWKIQSASPEKSPKKQQLFGTISNLHQEQNIIPSVRRLRLDFMCSGYHLLVNWQSFGAWRWEECRIRFVSSAFCLGGNSWRWTMSNRMPKRCPRALSDLYFLCGFVFGIWSVATGSSGFENILKPNRQYTWLMQR